MVSKLLAAVFSIVTTCASAGELHKIPIQSRPYDDVPLLVNVSSRQAVNLILIPGGNGGMGRLVDGIPTSNNFLVRSRGLFTAQGFNTYVQFRAGSVEPKAMATIHRESRAHFEEIRAVVEFIKARSPSPIWIVGTSMGTVSAINAARNLDDNQIRGFVLTSSVVTLAPGNVLEVDLTSVRKPTLVVHHKEDQCRYCDPTKVLEIPKRFSAARPFDLIMLGGGGPATGDPCQSLHFHGFIGLESEVVLKIAEWIRKNTLM